MKLLHRIAVALAALCLTAGCATLSDVVQSKNEGMVQVYPVTGDQAWAIALRVSRGVLLIICKIKTWANFSKVKFSTRV